MAVCPNCGTSLTQPAAPAPQPIAAPAAVQPAPVFGGAAIPAPKKKRTGLFVGIAAVAVVAAVVVLLFTGVFSGPVGKFRKLHEATLIDPLVFAIESAEDVSSQIPEINTDVTATITTGDPTVDAILGSAALDLKMESDEDSLLLNVGAAFGGTNILDAIVSLEDGKIGLELPQYGTNLVLDPMMFLQNMSGTAAVVPSWTGNLSSGVDFELVAKIFGRYAGLVLDVVDKDNLTVEKNVSYSSVPLGKVVNGATRYTLMPTNADLAELMVAIADAMQKDKDLVELLTPYIDPMTMGMDAQSTINMLAQQLRTSAVSMQSNPLATSEIPFVLVTYAKGARILSEQIFDGYGYTTVGGWNSGYGVDIVTEGDSTAIAVWQGSGSIGMMDYTTYCNATFTDGKDAQTLLATFTDDWGDTYNLNLNLSKNSMTFHFTDHYNVDLRINGTMEDKKSALNIPYGSYTVLYTDIWDETTYTVSMQVSADASGGTLHKISMVLPDAPVSPSLNLISTDKPSTAREQSANPVDVSGYNEDQLMQLFLPVVNGMSELFSNFGF